MSDVGIIEKLEQIAIRYDEIAKQMVDPEVINDMGFIAASPRYISGPLA